MLIKEDSIAEIIKRARSGSRDAFDALIRHFEQKVMKTALYLTRNPDDAQDVAQEVYVKIFRHLQACEGSDRIEQWIYRITVNAARDFQRRRRFSLPLETIGFVTRSHDSVFRDEIRNRLIEALESLSFSERAAFILKELEEKETAEVAEILGCRVVTVRSHLHSARKKLQKHFRDFRESLWTD